MAKGKKFKKGVSGNPAGRPKASQNWRTLIGEGLQETIAIKENGKIKKVTLTELVIKSLIKQCLNGNPASIEFLLNGFTNGNQVEEKFVLNMGKDLKNLEDK